MRKRPSRRNRDRTQRSNLQAAVLTTIALGVAGALVLTPLVRQAWFTAERVDWTKSVPWDPSWPSLPASNIVDARDVAQLRALYAFAGKNADVLRYIPCYCGCQSQGHRSDNDCYVAQRSSDGRVTEWNGHGMTCPVGRDIAGDVMVWRENGRPLLSIRDDIEREFGLRGPATPTPPVPVR